MRSVGGREVGSGAFKSTFHEDGHARFLEGDLVTPCDLESREGRRVGFGVLLGRLGFIVGRLVDSATGLAVIFISGLVFVGAPDGSGDGFDDGAAVAAATGAPEGVDDGFDEGFALGDAVGMPDGNEEGFEEVLDPP